MPTLDKEGFENQSLWQNLQSLFVILKVALLIQHRTELCFFGYEG